MGNPEREAADAEGTAAVAGPYGAVVSMTGVVVAVAVGAVAPFDIVGTVAVTVVAVGATCGLGAVVSTVGIVDKVATAGVKAMEKGTELVCNFRVHYIIRLFAASYFVFSCVQP